MTNLPGHHSDSSMSDEEISDEHIDEDKDEDKDEDMEEDISDSSEEAQARIPRQDDVP